MFERIVSGIRKSTFKISHFAGVFGAFLLTIMVLFTVTDVILRRFFNSPIRGSIEIFEIILGISVFTTLAFVALTEGGHVEVLVLVDRFKKRIQNAIVSCMYFITTVFIGLMGYRLVLHAIKIYRTHEVSAIWSISSYPFIIVAALGTFLLAVVFLVHTLQKISEVRKK